MGFGVFACACLCLSLATDAKLVDWCCSSTFPLAETACVAALLSYLRTALDGMRVFVNSWALTSALSPDGHFAVDEY